MKQKGFKIFLLALVFVAGVLLTSACSKSMDSIAKKLTNYNIVASFDESKKILECEEDVNYINPYDVSLTSLSFHLYPNSFRQDAKNKVVSSLHFEEAYPNGFNEGKITIKTVLVNGSEKNINITGKDENILSVPLDFELFPDDRVNVEINFEVLIPNIHHRFGYGDNSYNFGNFYPVVCIYEDGAFREDCYIYNGDPFYSDVANYSVNLTFSEDLTLASTGEKLSEIVENGKKTVQIQAKVVRDFAFVLGKNYKQISSKAGDTTVIYYYHDDENAGDSLKAGVDAINTFSNLFGAYPYSTYSIVQTSFVHGGMEYPMLVYISDSVEDKTDYKNVIIHETAHQWWYGMVGSDPIRHSWMDEGLTEYSTLMFYRANSDYGVDIKESVNSSLSSYILFSRIYESVYGSFDSRMDRDIYSFSGDMDYTYITYVKGVLFFENLEESIGQKAFLKALKTYYNKNKFSIAKKEDMIGAFESVSHKNLESLFSSWLDGKVILQAS